MWRLFRAQGLESSPRWFREVQKIECEWTKECDWG